GREESDPEPGEGAPGAARPAAEGRAGPPGGGAVGAAPGPGRRGRTVGEDPDLQLQGKQGHRPSHRAHAAQARQGVDGRARRRRRRSRRRREGSAARGRGRLMTTGEPEPEVRQAAAAPQVALTWRHLYSLATERLGSDIEARRIVERASGREGPDWLL